MQKNIGNDFFDFSDQQKIALQRRKIFDKAEKSSNMLKKSSKTLGGSRARVYLCIRIQTRIEPAPKARKRTKKLTSPLTIDH